MIGEKDQHVNYCATKLFSEDDICRKELHENRKERNREGQNKNMTKTLPANLHASS